MIIMYLNILWQKFLYTLTGKQLTYVEYPEVLNGYHLKEKLFTDYKHRSFRYALYEKGSEVVFAKIWIGSVKNYDYYSLKHEANIYRAFQEVEEANSPIKIPKLIHIEEQGGMYALIISKIHGQTIEHLPYPRRIQIYEQCMQYFQTVGRKLEAKTRYKLPLFMLLFYYPICIFLAIVKYPKQLFFFSSLLWKFMTHMRAIFLSYKYSYVHRSLEDHNILLSEKDTYLIDFQLGVLTHPYFEIAQTLVFNWHDKGFVEAFMKSQTYKKTQATEGNKTLLSIIATYTGLQQVVSGHKDTELCMDYIRYFTSSTHTHLSLYERVSFTIYRLLARLKNPKTHTSVILCYHSVGDDGWRFSTPISEFEKQIEYLRKNYSIVPLEQLLREHKANQLAVTFDDGYENVYQNAYPILKKYDLGATVFVIGSPKQANREELDNELPLMNSKTLTKLIENGWDIGFHTKTHCNLDAITGKDLLEEVVRSKAQLEKDLNTTIQYFAYPRGIYNQNVLDILHDSGYTAAFTVEAGNVLLNNPFLISRMPIEGRFSLEEFMGFISEPGRTVTCWFMKMLVLKEKYLSL